MKFFVLKILIGLHLQHAFFENARFLVGIAM
jgi:hypothetical protein